MIVADDELNAVEAALLQALQKLSPMQFGFGEFATDAQHGAFAFGIEADGDQNGAGDDVAVVADFFVTGVENEIRDAAQRASAPLQELVVQFGGGAADLGGSDFQAAELLEDGGDFAGGDDLTPNAGQFISRVLPLV